MFSFIGETNSGAPLTSGKKYVFFFSFDSFGNGT